MNGELFLILIISQLVLWIFVTKIGLGKSVSFVFGSILIILAYYRLLFMDPDIELVCSANNFGIIKNGIINCSLSSKELFLVAIVPWVGYLCNAYILKIKQFTKF
ncbi:hypothetical protein HNP87_001281 [Methanococcus maripaludis]|uniref:Uncharacterized protein n=1 Tax=Methanococcus maripaludis TaxID=39152 RepID=A0A7J9NKD5_METMI|nr:hypothetical protein [Methanococcus maripaludis]MBA2840749.1 hypothetical protein [Methanococcus maripaludis]